MLRRNIGEICLMVSAVNLGCELVSGIGGLRFPTNSATVGRLGTRPVHLRSNEKDGMMVSAMSSRDSSDSYTLQG